MSIFKSLEFREFLCKVKTELKIIQTVLADSSESGLVRIEQIEDPIGDGIVKKAWNPEKSFRHDEDSFYQHLEFDTLPQINRCKIRDR